MKKKQKVFHPCTIPRYLPGSVSGNTLRSDLKEYNKHRYKVSEHKENVSRVVFIAV